VWRGAWYAANIWKSYFSCYSSVAVSPRVLKSLLFVGRQIGRYKQVTFSLSSSSDSWNCEQILSTHIFWYAHLFAHTIYTDPFDDYLPILFWQYCVNALKISLSKVSTRGDSVSWLSRSARPRILFALQHSCVTPSKEGALMSDVNSNWLRDDQSSSTIGLFTLCKRRRLLSNLIQKRERERETRLYSLHKRHKSVCDYRDIKAIVKVISNICYRTL
jgi:hypothetical protein